MILELADGRKFRVADSTPEEKVRAFVLSKIRETQPIRPAPAPAPVPVTKRQKEKELRAKLMEALAEAETAEAAEYNNTAELNKTMASVLKQMEQFTAKYDGYTSKTEQLIESLSDRISTFVDSANTPRSDPNTSAMVEELTRLRSVIEHKPEHKEDYAPLLTEIADRISSIPRPTNDEALVEGLTNLRNDLNTGLKRLNDAYMAETRVVLDEQTGYPIGSRRVNPDDEEETE